MRVLILCCYLILGSISISSSKTIYENEVAVLLYHDFSKTENNLSITPDRFEEHLRMLKQHSFNVINMEQFMDFMLYGKAVPSNAVLITFDDGYEDFYKVAYPILKRNSMVASNFVIVSASDVPNPHSLPHLTWDQMRYMKQNGMGFYSHTYDLHYFLDNAAPALIGLKEKETELQYANSVHYDFFKAQYRLDKELGRQSEIISFPYGAYNEEIIRDGEDLGIKLFFTTKNGINFPGENEVRRINAGMKGMSADHLLEILSKLPIQSKLAAE